MENIMKMEHVKYMTLKMAWAPKPKKCFIVEYYQGMVLGDETIKKCILRAEKEMGERFETAFDDHESVDVMLKYIGFQPDIKLHVFDLLEIKKNETITT